MVVLSSIFVALMVGAQPASDHCAREVAKAEEILAHVALNQRDIDVLLAAARARDSKSSNDLFNALCFSLDELVAQLSADAAVRQVLNNHGYSPERLARVGWTIVAVRTLAYSGPHDRQNRAVIDANKGQIDKVLVPR